MTKSVKVKIILIISLLTLSALIMTYKYFTEFKQTQIDKQEAQDNSWDSPINQFEFADPENTQNQEQQAQGSISKIDLNRKAFLKIEYASQPFINAPNAKELADKIAVYGKDPVIRNFVKDMNKALGRQEQDFNSLPPVEEFKKQMTSTQTQKILLQYSKDPAFRKAVQQMMQDPAIMTGFINYINQPEQKSSK